MLGLAGFTAVDYLPDASERGGVDAPFETLAAEKALCSLRVEEGVDFRILDKESFGTLSDFLTVFGLLCFIPDVPNLGVFLSGRGLPRRAKLDRFCLNALRRATLVLGDWPGLACRELACEWSREGTSE